MTLYFPTDESDITTGSPGLHALIIGVDKYDHLGLNVDHSPSRLLSGLSDLTTTVPSALQVAAWLHTEYTNSDCPIRSIEMLLSPAQTIERPDGQRIQVDKASMANIEQAAAKWFRRCDTAEGNIAFFYFAGHGINTISKFLLPADFGDPTLPDDWRNCIDASGLQTGMTRCKAQHQYFFLDACRDAPLDALTQRKPQGNPLVGGADFDDTVELSAEYSAASEGRQAYGRDGKGTFFSEALVLCLDGMGAGRPGRDWRVDAASLGNGLMSVMQSLAEREDLPLSCECRVQRPVPLHYPSIGKVLVKIDCDDPQRKGQLSITLRQGQLALRSPAGDPRPWIHPVKAGIVDIDFAFASGSPETLNEQLVPPVYNLVVPL